MIFYEEWRSFAEGNANIIDRAFENPLGGDLVKEAKTLDSVHPEGTRPE